MLHDDPDLFEQLVLQTSNALGIAAGIVEKDYYVTVFLKELQRKRSDIIFKGGTSLSKCYHLINRFSEDLDLNIECEEHPSESKRRELKRDIVGSIDALGFTLENPDDIHSRRDFNRYVIRCPSAPGSGFLKEHLIVETALSIRSFPSQKMSAGCFLYDHLHGNGQDDWAQEHGLTPFDVKVQTAERTFLDKLFALGDYFLNGTIAEHSRHIYDVYKLSSIIVIDDELKQLAKEVAAQRSVNRMCPSARADMGALLQQIIDKAVYREDYENSTSKLLFETVEYQTAIAVLPGIIRSGLFQF